MCFLSTSCYLCLSKILTSRNLMFSILVIILLVFGHEQFLVLAIALSLRYSIHSKKIDDIYFWPTLLYFWLLPYISGFQLENENSPWLFVSEKKLLKCTNFYQNFTYSWNLVQWKTFYWIRILSTYFLQGHRIAKRSVDADKTS